MNSESRKSTAFFVFLRIAATFSFIPMSMLSYWLAYAIHGQGDRVSDLGGYAEYYLISPAFGILAGVLFNVASLFTLRRPVPAYCGCAGFLFLGYFVFSLLDCYTTLA